MRAFWSLARFEFRYQVWGPTFVVSFAVFFLLAFFATASDRVQIGGPSSVHLNAPSAIAFTIGVLTVFGLFIPTAMLSSAVIRDSEFKTEELFHSTPLSPKVFILGRFTGGFLATCMALASVPLAILLASQMPWIDPERLGPTRLLDYIYLFLSVGALNMLVCGLVFFTVANLTRSSFATYIALTIFLVAYFTGSALLDQPQYRTVAAIADPLAVNALDEMMRYWTPAERNTNSIPFAGTFLINRLLWLTVAGGLLAFNLATFSFRRRAPKRRKSESAPIADDGPVRIELPRETPETDGAWTQFWTRTRFEAGRVVRSPAFWILLMLGMLNTVGGLLLSLDVLYGTPSYPMTRVMLQVIAGAFGLIPLIVAVYYASELVWRERVIGISDVIDATPTPSWVFVASKFIALSLVAASLYGAAIATAIVVQLAKGHVALELDQYALRYLVDFIVPIAIFAVLCVFVQVVTNNRWLGIIVVVIYLVGTLTAANFGYDHNLLIYGSTPNMPFSDMNGYGHFLSLGMWFNVYWACWAVVLATLAYVLWNRGALRPVVGRFSSLARASIATKSILAFGVAGVLISGGWIFYNTNVRNTYTNTVRLEERALDFEDTYRETYERFAQPKVIGVEVNVDIYPRERRAVFEGTYTLLNRTDEAIKELVVDYDYNATVIEHAIEGGRIEEVDTTHNVHRFILEPPMASDEKRTLSFHTERRNPGFKNSANVSKTNFNGTFLNNSDAMPAIGFNAGKMLQPRNERRRYDREPLPRAPDLDDESYFRENLLRPDSDWVDFAVTISTDPDQLAVAPGYLEREWQEDGRRYFRYAMDRPINNFFSFQSAAYEVAEDTWNGIELQVFHHPEHGFNVERMMTAMKSSFEYFTEEFSPYQYRQMRVLEFPAYQRFAQSFANTVPFSESIGYVLDLRDEKDIDVVSYVTAHELAHQWWGHQVVPSSNQGATMLVETFAQYSALMVMKREYGEHAMRRFLKYELDSYLTGRANEPEAEKPLYRVENQPYIHYRKGSVVMYALQDRVGEDVVNRSLARLIEETANRIDPYPRTVDYLRILREEAGPEYDELITELFEEIVLFDLRVTEAKAELRTDGRYDVTFTVDATKLESDEKGKEEPVPFEMPIDVGVFSEDLESVYEGDDHVLVFEKRPVKTGENTFTFTVGEAPVSVGIDPYNMLIDRVSEDNLRQVSVSGGS
ncbi:MAG: M1 family aminopeptidase [Myxococcota bacterium]